MWGLVAAVDLKGIKLDREFAKHGAALLQHGSYNVVEDQSEAEELKGGACEGAIFILETSEGFVMADGERIGRDVMQREAELLGIRQMLGVSRIHVEL